MIRKGGILNSMLATVIDVSKIGDPAQGRRRHPGGEGACEVGPPGAGLREVLTPGEPERRYAEKRAREGIEVDDTTWRDIRAAAANRSASRRRSSTRRRVRTGGDSAG